MFVAKAMILQNAVYFIGMFSGMEISEVQRKQAVQNARKSKQGKIKSM